jgi:glycosyltransferase involved in cell wall biosynthesis
MTTAFLAASRWASIPSSLVPMETANPRDIPRARLVFSVADLHYLRLARQAIAERRPELAVESRRSMRREMLSMLLADAVITHSTFEAESIRQIIPADNIQLVTWPEAIRPRSVPFADRQGFAFIGNFGHQPNIDAAVRLIKEITPLVSQTLPYATCLIVGGGLPPEIAGLCSDTCRYVGQVPSHDDIFDQVRVTVAPLSFGAGIKGKVVSSLAAGIPCVCTPIAAEGRLLQHASDDNGVLAASMIKLHEDAQETAEIANLGIGYVAERFSEETVLNALYDAVGTKRGTKAP